jgi:transposase
MVRMSGASRLLMSVPGVGVLSALAYVSTVENPSRFARSRSVGAHLGLTPRQYQSVEVDRSGRVRRAHAGCDHAHSAVPLWSPAEDQ